MDLDVRSAAVIRSQASLGMTPLGFQLAMHLMLVSDKDAHASLRQEDIAHAMGTSVKVARKAISQLEESSLLLVKRHRGYTAYDLSPLLRRCGAWEEVPKQALSNLPEQALSNVPIQAHSTQEVPKRAPSCTVYLESESDSVHKSTEQSRAEQRARTREEKVGQEKERPGTVLLPADLEDAIEEAAGMLLSKPGWKCSERRTHAIVYDYVAAWYVEDEHSPTLRPWPGDVLAAAEDYAEKAVSTTEKAVRAFMRSRREDKRDGVPRERPSGTGGRTWGRSHEDEEENDPLPLYVPTPEQIRDFEENWDEKTLRWRDGRDR